MHLTMDIYSAIRVVLYIAPATLLSSSSNPFSIEKLFVIFPWRRWFSFNCRVEREHLLLVKCNSNGHTPKVYTAAAASHLPLGNVCIELYL